MGETDCFMAHLKLLSGSETRKSFCSRVSVPRAHCSAARARVVEITAPSFDSPVVVALENHCACHGVAGDDLDNFTSWSIVCRRL